MFLNYVCVHAHVCVPDSAGASDSPEARVTDCELPFGCWEINSGPLEKQQVFLTTELSLQLNKLYIMLLLIYKVRF